jgi:hypothetical protein
MGTGYKLQVAGYRFEAPIVNAGDICRYPTCNP